MSSSFGGPCFDETFQELNESLRIKQRTGLRIHSVLTFAAIKRIPHCGVNSFLAESSERSKYLADQHFIKLHLFGRHQRLTHKYKSEPEHRNSFDNVSLLFFFFFEVY